MKEYKDYAKITAHFDLAIEEAIKFGGDVGKHAVLLFETMRKELDTVPAADVVEVRHGRWDDSGRYMFPNGETAVCCTECGCALRKKEYENNNWFYCPVCGALMDKEE